MISARSMDWKSDVATKIWIFPQGTQRNGEVGANSIKWRSRYGSVIASGYDIATTDGVNQAGLMTNLLWLAESAYPMPNIGKPGLSIAAGAQYVLDNYVTVAEAVAPLEKELFTLVTSRVPGGFA